MRDHDNPLLSKPTTAAGKLQRRVLDLLNQHAEAGELPTSVRFLFYELEQAGAVSKRQRPRPAGVKGRRPDQNLADAVKHLRDCGAIPWEWIVDDTRQLHYFDGSRSVAEDLRRFVDASHIDPWGDGLHPFVLAESRTIGGVFARTIAPDYRVPVAATNGQAGGFLVTEIAPQLTEQSLVLYVGDLDLAGDSIEANTHHVLERWAAARGWRADQWERVAITTEQADDLHQRGVEPIIKTDKRNKITHEAYEAEALGQGPVTRLLQGHLDAMLAEPIGDVHVRAAGQRERMTAFLATWNDEGGS